MYKKQMAFQKIICFIALFVGAAVFIYTLGFATDLYECLYKTMMDPNNLSDTYVPGSIVFYNIQDFNRAFTSLSVIALLISGLLFLTNTHSRRKYYVGNYIAIAVKVIADIGFVSWAHFEIEKYKAEWLQVDFESLKAFSEMFKTSYTESTFWFDAHYVLFGLVLFVALMLVINLIWKLILMKTEKRLIANGKGAAA